MNRFILTLIALLPALIACTPPKASQPQSRNPAPNANGQQNSANNGSQLKVPVEILGAWMLCLPMEDGGGDAEVKPPLGSTGFVITFQSGGQVNEVSSNYKDKACKTKLTKADVDGYISKASSLKLPIDEAETRKVLQGSTMSAQISALKSIGNGSYEVDVNEQGKTDYATLRVHGNSLSMSSSCSQDDVKDNVCEKVVGDSAKNRSQIDNKSTVFQKVK